MKKNIKSTLFKWTTLNFTVQVDDGTLIQPMNGDETYKYLGFQQSKIIDHTIIKQQLRTSFKKRLQCVLKTGLNSKNIVLAISSFVVPILSYLFGIIKWSSTDLLDLNRQLRVTLKKHRFLHPKSELERITPSRNIGGRGTYTGHCKSDQNSNQ
jgi:hypothetical protein